VIYADILLLIPIGFALIQHGGSIPVVLTFMIAASGLSLPEMFVLGRILRPSLLCSLSWRRWQPTCLWDLASYGCEYMHSLKTNQAKAVSGFLYALLSTACEHV
jgi:hypothetical protein